MRCPLQELPAGGTAPSIPREFWGCSASSGVLRTTGSQHQHGQGGGTRQPGPEIPLHSRPRHRGTPSPCRGCPEGPRPLWGGTFPSPRHISISSPISGANCRVLWRLTGSLGDSIRRAGSEPRQEVLLFPQGSCEKALPYSLPPSLPFSRCLHLISKGAVLSPPDPRVLGSPPEHPPAPGAAPRCSASLSAGFSRRFQLFDMSGVQEKPGNGSKT